MRPEAMIAFVREALGLPAPVDLALRSLGGRGSDRTYFRVRWNPGGSAILVHYDPKRVENGYYPDIALFLEEIRIPVPHLLRHDPVACLIVMEDLGDTDLWAMRGAPRETRHALYRKTLAAVHRLHAFPVADFPSDGPRLMEGFGPALYRWERDYFRTHLVRDVCGIDLGLRAGQALEDELSALAERIGEGATCLVHRDLQSQNVMIRREEPFLIDFQGMRLGSPFYDLGSLLCDPYVDLSAGDRDDLLTFYYALSPRDVDWVAFRTRFWEASVQRLMQALGAYGFLGLKKGLSHFFAHIPAGLGKLVAATGQVTSLPLLKALAARCASAWDQRAPEGP
jgi:hypothetical protein